MHSNKTTKIHLRLAHTIWATHLRPGDTAIDATCGNGHDALHLAHLIGPTGDLLCIDIQESAIAHTQKRLGPLPQVRYLCASHALLPPITPRLIVYNLGYLPGGDKSLTTRTETTLASLRSALAILPDDGLLSVTCYPGHPEGARESKAVERLLRTHSTATVIKPEERESAPYLIFSMLGNV